MMVTQSLTRTMVQPGVTEWTTAYQRRLWVSDAVLLILVVLLTQYAWFTMTGEPVSKQVRPQSDASYTAEPVSGSVAIISELTYTWLSVGLILAWLAALAIAGSRSLRVIGIGTNEYRLVISSSLYLFALLAIVAYLTFTPVSRGFLLLTFPVGLAALLLSRAMWRRRLWAERRGGRGLSRVLVVGDNAESARIVAELDRMPEAGYKVVGVAGPGTQREFSAAGAEVPFYGSGDNIGWAMQQSNADTVIIASDAGLPVQQVRELSWQLEPGRQHLIMVPSLTDIGGPRIHTRPVAGLPLVHVETPRYTRVQRIVKRTFDVAGSGALLLLLAPLFLVLAILVKMSSPGPVFYRQERIGQEGQPFGMIKFRSMIPNADAMLAKLLEEQGTSDKPLHKIENDPRITPIGRILRKYSLDEFPQLVNVLIGDMSLVGPRPQREAEVAHYDSVAERRLIVKPGMSGLWQVSGRSALSWEEALRLDLYYVENWSLIGDISILVRTFKAVFQPGETAH